MKPTVGRIVTIKMHEQWAAEINRRRTNSESIRERIKINTPEIPSAGWPLGAQAHIGNQAKAGQQYAMVIVAIWSDTCVNGQVLLDGNDTFWATSVTYGENEGQWTWPVIAPVAPPPAPAA